MNLNYERISWQLAKKIMESKEVESTGLVACPCRLRPGAPWHPEIAPISFDESGVIVTQYDHGTFAEWCTNFKYYNCSNNETGWGIAWYVTNWKKTMEVKARKIAKQK